MAQRQNADLQSFSSYCTDLLMSTFDEAGFLSSESEQARSSFSTRYAAWKQLYYEINEFAILQFKSVPVDQSNKTNLLIYTCFYRMLTIYQSAYLLIERGNDTEGKALLRSLVESFFVAMAAHKDKNFAKSYIKIDERKEHEMMEDAVLIFDEAKKNKVPTVLSDKAVNDLRKKVTDYKRDEKDPKSSRYITKADEKATSIKQTAKTAESTHTYKSQYAYLCKFTHPAPYGMRQYFLTDINGRILSFNGGPKDRDTKSDLRIAITMMLGGLAPLADNFKLPIGAEVTAFYDRVNALTVSTDN